jgi:DnaJ-class molecular chaperone
MSTCIHGDEPDDYENDHDHPCSKCDGEKFVEADGFDEVMRYGSDLYRCPACNGTGLRKDQTIF